MEKNALEELASKIFGYQISDEQELEEQLLKTYIIGISLFQKNNYIEAAHEFEKIIKINDSFQDVTTQYAKAMAELALERFDKYNDYNGAKQVCTFLLNKNLPDNGSNVIAYTIRAQCNYKEFNIEQAIKDISDAINIADSNLGFLYYTRYVYRSLEQDLLEMYNDIKAASEHSPDNKEYEKYKVLLENQLKEDGLI